MSSNVIKSRRPSITARPTSTEKLQFTAVANRMALTESALALIAIRQLLLSKPHTSVSTPLPIREEAALDRITIRLRPGDGQAIADRAMRRGLKPSKYLAALVRAHVGKKPTLTSEELVALKQAVAVLAKLGYLLAQMHRTAATKTGAPDELLRELSRVRAVVAALERRVSDLTRAAIESWESGNA